MTDTLGFVVAARRPNPYKEHPWDYETVSAVFTDLAEAQSTLEYCRENPPRDDWGNSIYDGTVEYVVMGLVPVDNVPEAYEYPDDQNAREHAEYLRQRYEPTPYRRMT